MKAILLLLASVVGIFFTIRSARKYYSEVKSKQSNEHSMSDIWFNYPLQVIWNVYLIVFFVGLVVNNLIIK